MKRLITQLFDFLLPPHCPICNDPTDTNGQLCILCWNKFSWITKPYCMQCGLPFSANIDHETELLCPNCLIKKTKPDWLRSAAVYDDASRAIMLKFKHGGHLEYQYLMTRAMNQCLNDLPSQVARKSPSLARLPSATVRVDCQCRWHGCPQGGVVDLLILPVPLANRRLFKRGYNQAGLLARGIAKYLNAKIDYDSVRRTHKKDMGHLSPKERAKNISGVFRVTRPENIRGRNILLVDDVLTTGATFNELTKVLKRAGASWVGGISFCRTLKAI